MKQSRILVELAALMLLVIAAGAVRNHPLQLFIQVSDVDQVHGRIKQDVNIPDAPGDRTRGDREFTIADPDGYLLSFYTPL